MDNNFIQKKILYTDLVSWFGWNIICREKSSSKKKKVWAVWIDTEHEIRLQVS